MVVLDGLIRVFWPSNAAINGTSGVLVGFKNSAYDVMVVAVLEEVEPHQVEVALTTGAFFRRSPHKIQDLLKLCGHPSMCVLGQLNPSTPPRNQDTFQFAIYTDITNRLPRVCFSPESNCSAQVVFYERPKPRRMQFLSLDPIPLSLDKADVKWEDAMAGAEEEEARERRKNQALVEKLKQHTIRKRVPTELELALPKVIDQINCSWELNALLQNNIETVPGRRQRKPSVSDYVVDSAHSLWNVFCAPVHRVTHSWAYPVMSRIFVLVYMAIRIVAELVLLALGWRGAAPGSPASKDILATASQIDIRLQQFCYWPIQYITLRNRKATWGSMTNSHPEYIRFCNGLWLVANDVIMGMALGSYIVENTPLIASKIDTILIKWLIDGLRDMILWLTAQPGGFKLNTELADFIAALFLWIIDYWGGCIAHLRPFLPVIVRFMGFASFAGATMAISVFSDLLSLLTLHIHACYIASARLYHWELTVVISLFHLFRGKKWNVLRSRVDSCDYGLDELIIGTMLFTLSLFLLPTVLAFYVLFATARVAVIGTRAIMEIGLACLNHFPLFAVMLRMKDPGRVPGGICFELHHGNVPSSAEKDKPRSTNTAHISLKSIPLPIKAMFEQYLKLSGQIRRHYVSPSIIYRLVTGRSVPSIPRRNLYRLQYNMLPAARASISEVWDMLTLHKK
ncbi:Gpi1-domain-containing protein [Sporormia fimetaria CBS 119925]|uniref:Gpi1-domain-containing protein n=1 Tax=Sporormia fimetaria CBS 119925 TaxID=1340428 RepID=A0A6A6VCT6_9PLEO|nr:Gpi1-domain-containing protein [Sporormia fimetaria CBS 119925]